MFSVLVVCTANICRSPIAEYLFRRALTERGYDDADFHVWSAGVFADPGSPMTIADGSLAELQSRGVDAARHLSRPVMPEEVEAADLVVCMEAAHVREVVVMVPDSRSKTFTLVEMCDIIEAASQDGTVPDWPDVVAFMAERRPPFPFNSSRLDVADPIGSTAAAFAKCADDIERRVEFIATAMWGPGPRYVPPVADQVGVATGSLFDRLKKWRW